MIGMNWISACILLNGIWPPFLVGSGRRSTWSAFKWSATRPNHLSGASLLCRLGRLNRALLTKLLRLAPKTRLDLMLDLMPDLLCRLIRRLLCNPTRSLYYRGQSLHTLSMIPNCLGSLNRPEDMLIMIQLSFRHVFQQAYKPG
jgi:hypothetical protein